MTVSPARLLAAAALALSIGTAGVAQDSAKTVTGAATGPVAPITADRPQIGDFGFDAAGMDRSVAPGDDFYGFADGVWAKTTAIPADKPNYGAFDVLQDLSRERSRGLLEAAAKDPRSKIGTAYAAFLDTAAIEAKGLAPLRPWLTRVKTMASPADYAAALAQADVLGIATPFAPGVSQDAKAPDTYSVGLRQSGLGMPDRDYYLSTDAHFVQTKAAYQAHLAKLLTLAGEADAAARAAAVVDFETAIARVSWTRIDSRDADKTYNKVALADLVRTAPGFDFAAYLQRVGTPAPTVIVAQPSAITGEAALIGASPMAVLRDQLLVRSLESYASVLPTAFDDEQFAFAGTVLSGTPQQQDRWKRGVAFVETALTDDLSRSYVAKYFPPETKAAADDLVRNIIAAMNARIDRLDWMAPATKVKAHAKLAAFTPRIGYPTHWRDYRALTITHDAFANMVVSRAWLHAFNNAKLGEPIYRWEWGMTPMTVNAQANPTLVAITFPAAILQPPFFDPKADPAINYGGIGAVIGHEMSHHFDDQGAKFDLTGRLTQWWTDADVTRFNALEDRLAAEYDAYEPVPGMHVKGRLTLGENSADLAGLSAAYDAYHASLGGQPAPVIDGFTGDQRFYLGWAQVWRRSYRDADLRQRLLTDPHSPSEQRADIVRNMDPWYVAFGPKPTDKLYLTPEQRVRVW